MNGRFIGSAAAALLLVAGCSSDDGGGDMPIGATGGQSAAGTMVGTGGGGATGGGGGAAATGGSGGTSATGGSGGMVATGGSGGTSATGGSGGMAATGGSGGMSATGGSGGMSAIDAGSDADVDSSQPDGGPLMLTAADFADGDEIPASFRCDAPSPALSWTGGPAETMSYAIVFRDLTFPGIHWVIYDIPASTTSLAEGVPEGAEPGTPAGAKQAPITMTIANFVGTGALRFVGPCAPSGTNMYEFVLYAVDAATLPDVSESSDGEQVEAQIMAHSLETATLGISSGP